MKQGEIELTVSVYRGVFNYRREAEERLPRPGLQSLNLYMSYCCHFTMSHLC
jgi:hypothetical protein